MRSIALFVIGVVAVTGCASHHSRDVASRFIQRGEPAMRIGNETRPDDSLATFIEKVRVLSANARPAPADRTATVEKTDAELKAALGREAASPGGDASREVGRIYRRLGVLDLAYEHFARAARLDRRDALAYEEMARIWRDWGFAGLALGDAYRAIYYAPGSASAYNTLGTVFLAAGQSANALGAFRRALALAPGAPYALNNVCSALLALHRPQDAVAPCEQAVTLDPSLVAAQRNLAVATSAVAAALVAPVVVIGDGQALDSEPPDSGVPGSNPRR